MNPQSLQFLGYTLLIDARGLISVSYTVKLKLKQDLRMPFQMLTSLHIGIQLHLIQ